MFAVEVRVMADVRNDEQHGWPAHAPLPCTIPAPPSAPWTSLIQLLGPHALLWRDDTGVTAIIDVDFVRCLLRASGRPVAAEEQLALLLCTPLPVDFDLVAAVNDALTSGAYATRQRALLLVGRLGLHGCVEGAVRGIRDGDDDVRQAAWQAIARLGGPRACETALRCTTWHADDGTTTARLDSWSRLGLWSEPVSIEGATAEVGGWIERVCAALGGDPQGVLALLGHRLSSVRRMALGLFVHGVLSVGPYVEALAQRVSMEQDPALFPWLTRALGDGGAEASELVADSLIDESPTARAVACGALAELGPQAGGVRKSLRQCLADDEPAVVAEAVLALHCMGESVRELEGHLRGGGEGFSERLARLGQGLRSAEPVRALYGMQRADAALVALLRTGPSVLAEVACYTLALHLPAVAAPVLRAILRDDARDADMELRRAAAGALLLMGDQAAANTALFRLVLSPPGSAHPGADHAADVHHDELVALVLTDAAWRVRLEALRLLSVGPQVPAVLDHIERHEVDTDVLALAKSIRSPRWQRADVQVWFAEIMVPSASTDAARCLSRLVQADPTLAGVAAHHLLRSRGDRAACAVAAAFVGSQTPPDRLHQVVSACSAQLLHARSDVREDSARMLAHIPRSLWPEELLDEVEELLHERVRGEPDQAAKDTIIEALLRLDRPWDPKGGP